VRRAKIVATLGPASREIPVLEALFKAGTNVVRINMSHGSLEEHEETLKRVRTVSAKLNMPIAALVDLSGPKIRTGLLKGGEAVTLEADALFTITTRNVAGDDKEVTTNYARLPQDAKAGSRILLDDGAIELKVERTTETDVVCRVINGGVLSERKGINLPGVALGISAMTDKDRRDLQWAIKNDADYIALSFVRSAEDCREAQQLIRECGGTTPLVAKIEKAEAVDHLDEIVATADALMVARGDLGVETSVEMVPVYQKRIIEKANIAGKVVITATQMLQSMTTSPRPTRAEASDVANAVWDGTDALMLSAETATGMYPVGAVSTMAKIIESAEAGRPPATHARGTWLGSQSGSVSRAICEAATFAAEEMGARTIGVFTSSGLMARRLSTLRPRQRIIALTSSKKVLNELTAVWGVEPVLHEPCETMDQLLSAGEARLADTGAAQKDELVVLMAGRLSGLGLSSSIKLHQIGSAKIEKRG
jgi:pyruvate kinase